jgi:hypothetical protein
MKKYIVPVEWISTGHFEITAKDLDDLKEKIKDKDKILSSHFQLDGELFKDTLDVIYENIYELK